MNKRMREQERNWKSKKETRDQYVARLKKTVQDLEQVLVNDSIGDLVVRCERHAQARGGYVLEGGPSG